MIEGWAVDLANPELPVLLEVALGNEQLGTVLAADYRHDLFMAGLGRGYASYSVHLGRRFTLDERIRLVVRRAADGIQAGMSPDAQARAIAGSATAVCSAPADLASPVAA